MVTAQVSSSPLVTLFACSPRFGAPDTCYSDFKGEDGGMYVLLSTRNLSLAMGIEHSNFFTPHSKLWVHGSWIRHAYWVVRTWRGSLLYIGFHAQHPMFNNSRKPSASMIDDVHIKFDSVSLTVTTSYWRTRATVTRGRPHNGQLRINIDVQPLYDIMSDPVSPHGLLGQTFDGDNSPLHGKQDRYDLLDDGRPTRARLAAGGLVTTVAKAEGAIEGESSMYRISSPFDTNFTFTRFGVDAAAPRNISKLRQRQQNY